MKIEKVSILPGLILLALLYVGFVDLPAESATRRYQYQVITVTGMKELRTQQDSDQGRMKAIENIINEQSSRGWEFYQADGYVLYFRK